MCPQYTDAPAVRYLTIKLQNSTWYKCVKLSLTGSRMYVRTHIHTGGHKFVRTYPRTENRKTICPWHHPMWGHKNFFKMNFQSEILISEIFQSQIGCMNTLYSIYPKYLGPVVQSIISLTSLLVVKMLNVLVSTISNSKLFLLKKCE